MKVVELHVNANIMKEFFVFGAMIVYSETGLCDVLDNILNLLIILPFSFQRCP